MLDTHVQGLTVTTGPPISPSQNRVIIPKWHHVVIAPRTTPTTPFIVHQPIARPAATTTTAKTAEAPKKKEKKKKKEAAKPTEEVEKKKKHKKTSYDFSLAYSRFLHLENKNAESITIEGAGDCTYLLDAREYRTVIESARTVIDTNLSDFVIRKLKASREPHEPEEDYERIMDGKSIKSIKGGLIGLQHDLTKAEQRLKKGKSHDGDSSKDPKVIKKKIQKRKNELTTMRRVKFKVFALVNLCHLEKVLSEETTCPGCDEELPCCDSSCPHSKTLLSAIEREDDDMSSQEEEGLSRESSREESFCSSEYSSMDEMFDAMSGNESDDTGNNNENSMNEENSYDNDYSGSDSSDEPIVIKKRKKKDTPTPAATTAIEPTPTLPGPTAPTATTATNKRPLVIINDFSLPPRPLKKPKNTTVTTTNGVVIHMMAPGSIATAKEVIIL